MANMVKTALGYILPREAYLLISRSVTGQGGYQSRLRQLQAMMGIEPNAEADSQSPRARTLQPSTETAQRAAPAVTRTLPATADDLDQERQILASARLLLETGDTEGARLQMERLITADRRIGAAVPISVPAVDQDDDDTDTDDSVDVSDLEAVQAKARKVRAVRAAMRALGRSRKSPKLTKASEAKRTYRMLQLHHGKGATVSKRMAAKYGAGWKALIK